MKIYRVITKKDCEYCQKAIELILENGDDFTVFELKDQSHIDLYRAFGLRTVPYIVGIGGYQDLHKYYSEKGA